MSTIKIDQDQIDGQIVNSVTGTGVDNTDPKNPKVIIPSLEGYATQIWVNSQGFMTQEADPWGVQSHEVTGTTTKTLKTTLRNGTIISASWSDLNTTYNAMTAADLTTGTNTENKLIAAVTLVNYINTRLATTMRYKGQVTSYSSLPTSGNSVGDVYNIVNANTSPALKAGDNVAWNGTTWDVLAGFVDTSMFLTSEADPTGVANISVSGTTTKTVTVSLNNGTTKTATWTDTNTTYNAGALATLNAGASNTAELWSAKILNDWLNGKSLTTLADVTTFLGGQKSEVFIIAAGNISSGVVSLNLSTPRKRTNLILAFYNGVKLPGPACTLNTEFNRLLINQSQIAAPIKVGKQVEVVYMG